MQTTEKISRRVTRIEVSAREIAILEAAAFDALVRLFKDSKAFDITNPDDDENLMDSRMESETLKGIQRKLEFARKQIEMDEAQ